MAAFDDLSTELLLGVAQCLESDRQTLLCLSCVNKRMRNVATQVLARKVDIDIESRNGGQVFPFLPYWMIF